MNDISYILNHLGEERVNYYNAVSPPIFQTSNFVFNSVSHMKDALSKEKNAFIYSRGNNPTLNILSKKLAALEGTEEALVFSSGMAAISTAVMSAVQSGDHIICVDNPYSWTNILMKKILPRYNVHVTMINGTDINNFEEAISKNTKLIYLESPNSFTFEIQDIKAVVELAKKHDLLTAIDNSFASPLTQSPSEMGVDIILHSASKYLGGHSDVVAGVLCSSKEIITRIFNNEFLTFGGIISPFNAWLILRGLRTLQIRIEKISQSTKKIIKYLENHPKIEKLISPFSVYHPQNKLAKKQLRHEMGLFSVRLRTNNFKEVEKFVISLKYFLIAVSWGGHESLVFPACTIDNPDKTTNMPVNLVRFYIGLDEPDILINDLENALKQIK